MPYGTRNSEDHAKEGLQAVYLVSGCGLGGDRGRDKGGKAIDGIPVGAGNPMLVGIDGDGDRTVPPVP